MTKTFTSRQSLNRLLKGLRIVSALINNGGNSSMNNIKMKFLLVTLALVFHVSTQADTLSIPKIFEDGEVAEATDFNQNFEYLRDQIDSNASWLNRNSDGIKEVNVDCSIDQDALRLAFQANFHVSAVSYYVTGTCFGGLDYIPISAEDGTTSYGRIYPTSHSYSISSNRQALEDPLNAASRVTIIPRSAHGVERVALLALQHSHMTLAGVDITMGADDNYGILFGPNSTGELNSITVTGMDNNTLGIDVVDGGTVQLKGTSQVTGVHTAIRSKNNSLIRNKGTMYAGGSYAALNLIGGEWLDDEQGRVNLWGTSNSANSLVMDNGAQAALNSLKMGANISVRSASTAKINYFGSDLLTANVQLLSSGLTIITGVGGNSNYDISRFACSGMSFLNIDTIDVRNQDGNNCLDDAGWSVIINANFP